MLELMLEKYAGRVNVITIGATRAEGGTCAKAIQVAGEQGLPFLFPEAEFAHKPVIAFELWDIPPLDWPLALTQPYADVLVDPLRWAEKCAQDFKAEILCLRLLGAHPDFGNKTIDEEAKFLQQFLKVTQLPLIILGCGDDDKDNSLLPVCCQLTRGQRCLIGSATQDNYKTLAAAVMADGHNIIAESPIDINIAKQLNILISDIGLPLERIVINPTIGALGYGLEYGYSIMERSRLAALAGDRTISSPFICFVGQEAWRAKESKVALAESGIAWEVVTAVSLIQAGADILVMRHPVAIEKVKKYIDSLSCNRRLDEAG
jgi:acetyl-CoA decarbonylase/synthase complex subunit delta